MQCKINGVGVCCIRNAAVSNVTMYEKIISFSAVQRYREGTGRVPGGYREGTGRVPGGYREGTGRVPAVC